MIWIGILFVAKLANVEVLTVIAGHTSAVLIALAVTAPMLTLVSYSLIDMKLET